MIQTRLTNGVTVCYEQGVDGPLLVRYPDGTQIRTTWNQLGHLERLVQSLRDVYEHLLLRESGERPTATFPIDKLAQLDDLLQW